MKEKKIFIYLVSTWFMLLSIYIYLEKTGVKIFQVEKVKQKITLQEAQDKIDTLLLNNPIVFNDNSSTLLTTENNQSLHGIVELLKQVDDNMFVNITSHTEVQGKNSKNRILSQKRAESLLTFIQERYPLKTMDAIGFGEEFPLSKEENQTLNREIAIRLYLLPPKI